MRLTAVGDPAVDRELARRVAALREAAKPEPPEPLPPAEIPWHEAGELELSECPSAKRLLAKALRAGWKARAWHARGPYMGARGENLGTADAITIKVSWGSGPLEAFAMWSRRDGKDSYDLDSAWLARPLMRMNTITLGQWLTGEGPKPKKEKA